jgi:hypothetical protein
VRLACIPTAQITIMKQMQAMWAAVVERNEAAKHGIQLN